MRLVISFVNKRHSKRNNKYMKCYDSGQERMRLGISFVNKRHSKRNNKYMKCYDSGQERMRLGISFVNKRHSKRNNKYMKCYDSGKENKYITYLAANLYGWEMSQYLPYSEFKWLSKNQINGFCLNSIKENSSIGYILEVDLDYSGELHELDNDYYLAPENVSQNTLSNY